MIDWDSHPVTSFQRKVYEAVLAVPCGYVTTYQLLGNAIGCRSPRAIGQALRRNPFAPVVPCHRVIATGATIGGFAGKREGAKITEKRKLLLEEGVTFTGGRLTDTRRIFDYSTNWETS